MPFVLIILGVFLALVGLGAIAAGAPSWALGLGLGSALIQSGTMGLVGGFLLVGIGFVLRFLRDLSRKIDMLNVEAIVGSAASARAPIANAASARVPAKREPIPARREPSPFPPRGERIREERAREERAYEKRAYEEHAYEERAREERDEQTEQVFAPEINDYAEPDDRGRTRIFPPPPEPRMSERQYPAHTEPRRQERGRERPRLHVERPAPPISEDTFDEQEMASSVGESNVPEVSATIVRSGIISGMAYTLYADGSIEAELPIGTVRFASIEELQDHVNQTGEDADVDFGAPKSRSD